LLEGGDSLLIFPIWGTAPPKGWPSGGSVMGELPGCHFCMTNQQWKTRFSRPRPIFWNGWIVYDTARSKKLATT